MGFSTAPTRPTATWTKSRADVDGASFGSWRPASAEPRDSARASPGRLGVTRDRYRALTRCAGAKASQKRQDQLCRQPGGDVVEIARGVDLDHVEPLDPWIGPKPEQSIVGLPGRDAAWQRCSRTGRIGLVEAIDIKRDVDRLGFAPCNRDRLLQRRRHASYRYVTRGEDG